MQNQITIPITNGKGSKEIVNGNYNVSATAAGYDSSTLSPKTVTIENNVNTSAFTIAGTGVLTLHVTDSGDETIGVPIEGAIFYRCDYQGNTYGNPITTDAGGDAHFNNIPFTTDSSTAPTIYFKQTKSDGSHTFSPDLQSTKMDSEQKTIQIANPEAAEKNFTLYDKNYPNLPIADGTLTLSN